MEPLFPSPQESACSSVHPYAASPSSAGFAFHSRARWAPTPKRAISRCSRRRSRTIVERYSLQGQLLGDVGAGAVLKHSQDFNLTREAVLDSGLSPATPAFDLQRACGTSLDTAIVIGLKIATGQIDSGIAAGVDTASDVPIVYPRAYQQLLLRSARGRSFGEKLSPWLGLRPSHFKPRLPGVVEPRTGLSMGQSCELMARTWGDSRARSRISSHSKVTARLRRRGMKVSSMTSWSSFAA